MIRKAQVSKKCSKVLNRQTTNDEDRTRIAILQLRGQSDANITNISFQKLPLNSLYTCIQ